MSMTVVEYHTAEELQALFRQEREARRGKRIWIVWQARLGQTAPEIANGIGVSRRAVQEWVRRYNGEGLAGLEIRSGQGREPILSEHVRQLVAQRVEAGPQDGDVCSLRGVDFQKFLESQVGKWMSLTSVYRLLHELGYEWLVPRPKHRKSDPDAVVAFQKKVPEELARIQAEHPDRQVVVFFQDECRFGQQGTLTRGWSKRGSRPTFAL